MQSYFLTQFVQAFVRLTKSEEILLQLRALSKEFNTEIRIQDSKGYIDMNESK